MKHITAGVKLGILTLLVAIGGYYIFKMVGDQGAGERAYPVYAKFKDASGLPLKSRVVIAGLPVGEVSGRRLDGRFAKLTVRVREGTELWSNAAAYKKSSSLLGEYYLELDPGTAESISPEGKVVKNERLAPGDEIQYVYEAATADELMRRVSETMPRVNEVLIEVRGLSAEARDLVHGPIRQMADRLNETVQTDAKLVDAVLARADRAMANIESITDDVRKVTGRAADGQIASILDNVERASTDLRDTLALAKSEVGATGASIRDKLDRMDGALASLQKTLDGTASITEKLDEGEGTLGKLVNDPQIGDDIGVLTSSVSGFVQSAFGMQTVVGVKSEYNFLGDAFKTYFALELVPRPDKFYLVEIVDDPRGKIVETLDAGPDGSLIRSYKIEEEFRFSFMFARRFSPFTVRLGIKESSGGIGGDVDLLGGKLRLSADVFDTSFDSLPRVKLQAAYNFFRWLYVYGGVDDLLNESQETTITPDNIAGQSAVYHFGLDYFAGAMLRFTDADLSALLFIGGSALGAL